MGKRTTTQLLATAGAAAMLAAAATGVATASPAAPASSQAAALRTVPIVMRDPGCHWFQVGAKYKIRLAVKGATAFRNLDEAALTFVGKNYRRTVAVGKTLTISKHGVYRITMVGQHHGDNTLVLVVK